MRVDVDILPCRGVGQLVQGVVSVGKPVTEEGQRTWGGGEEGRVTIKVKFKQGTSAACLIKSPMSLRWKATTRGC